MFILKKEKFVSQKSLSLIACCVLLLSNLIKTETIQQISLQDFLKIFPTSTALKCTNHYQFNLKPFPLGQTENNDLYPSSGMLADVFILKIPQSTFFIDSNHGYVFVNNRFIAETQIKQLNFFNGQSSCEVPDRQTQHYINERAAIISHLYPYCYGHWILDILCQLALLEIRNIEYDYLITPYYAKYMKESLALWGIDQQKIVPLNQNTKMYAKTLIMPTAVTSTIPCITTANYTVDFLIKYVRNKLLNNMPNNVPTSSDKIFISRKDAGNKRSIPNEDEIFSLFETRGFTRYSLTSLSMVEQIALFHNAKEIVNFVGSGATNIIFADPGTKYIEITQSMIDPTFFFLTDIFNIEYYSIDASTQQDQSDPWNPGRAIPLTLITEFLQQHPEL